MVVSPPPEPFLRPFDDPIGNILCPFSVNWPASASLTVLLFFRSRTCLYGTVGGITSARNSRFSTLATAVATPPVRKLQRRSYKGVIYPGLYTALSSVAFGRRRSFLAPALRGTEQTFPLWNVNLPVFKDRNRGWEDKYSQQQW